jgi:hypothetical protein
MPRSLFLSGFRAACVRRFSDVASRAGRDVFSQATQSSEFETAAALPAFAPSLPMEALEPRQLMAISLSNGVLKIGGSDGVRNQISVMKSGTSNYVAKLNSTSQTFAASLINEMEIYGGNANDTITIDAGITKPSGIDARYGDDSISGGGGADTVYGDAGNDTIYGNGGNDSLYGEAGNDYVDGGTGTDKVDGGTGTNTVKNGETGTPAPIPAATGVAVTGIELWDVVANKKIQNLNGGETLDLARLPAKLGIVALGSSSAQSVRFGYDSNTNYRVESGKPWSISGDSSGKLLAFTLTTGSHKVTVTPYSKTGATGTAGTAKVVTFNVTRSGTVVTPPPSTGGGTAVGGIVPRDTSAAAPRPVITTVTDRVIQAGQSVSVNAMSSALNDGTPLTARYVWNFGDSGSKYNVLQGFNAAHFYTKSGTYTITLTLTNEAGKTATATTTVTVLGDSRKKIFVSSAGNDSNDGLSESRPIKTWAKAITKVNDDVEILFRGGDTFDVKTTMTIYKNNMVLGSYGSGRATLKYSGERNYTSMVWLGGQGGGSRTVENLIFDSIYTANEGKTGLPQALGIAGKGDTVINCEFRNLGYAINTSGRPLGLLVQDNTAPLKTGLRGYFAWASGDDLSFIGNYVSNVDGHVIRMADANRVLVAYNDFTNPNEDSGYRGTLTIHKGSYAYVANNRLTDGLFSVGPLGREDGLTDKGARWKWSVFEGNIITRSKFIVLHGAERTMFRNNIIKNDNDWGIEVEAFSDSYGRGVVDVTFANNTVINNGQAGSFIRVGGAANGIALVNNLFVAPNLVTGTTSAGPVFVLDNDLSSFSKIDGNVWPTPTIAAYAQGGINYVWPSWSNSAGYKTPAEWEAYGVVIKDYYQDTAVSSSYAPSTSSVAANAANVWAGVFTDMNGKMRPATGKWTAGAVEV